MLIQHGIKLFESALITKLGFNHSMVEVFDLFTMAL